MNKVYFWLSSILGLFFGLIGAVILFFIDKTMIYLSLLAGILFAVFLYIYLTVYMSSIEKKYRLLEKQLQIPILYMTDVNLRAEQKVLAVRLCFCKDRLIILSVEKKPYMIKTVLYFDISNWDINPPYSIKISTCTNEIFELQVATDELIATLKNTVGLEIKE